MPEYSRPLGDMVRNACKRKDFTHNEVAALIDADERNIINIENYKANTTLQVLYPLIRVLDIDSREIFNPKIAR